MTGYYFSIPTKIIYGIGELSKLGEINLPGKTALIITGGTSIIRLGYLDMVQELLEKQGCTSFVYEDVIPNPTLENVEAARSIALDNACDFIIGLGGGSSIDTAKAVAKMVTNPGNLWDYVQVGQGGRKAFQNAGIPLIAIPTTAGTGTEGNPTSVITNMHTGEKVGISCDFPVSSIVDPTLTVHIGPRYTAFQGFDALFHCIEAFISTNATPFSDPWALEGIRLIFDNLPQAVSDGNNLVARSALSRASTLGGMVISISSCTAAHTIEHALTGLEPSLIHGEGLLMISRAFHRYAAQQIPEFYARMAEAVGVSESGKNDKQKAADFLTALEALKIACGVNELSLADHDFTLEDIDQVISGTFAIAGGVLKRDRFAITGQDLKAILQDSFA